MKKIKLLFSVILAVFIFTACSTDVEVNGEWKDIPIVYCILDASSPIQYVKVNKSFLGNIPASQMAAISDSLFYNKVEVVLNEYNPNNVKIASYTFDQVDTIPKPAGYFGNERNTLWVKQINLNLDNSYELVVTIDDGKHIVKSRTNLVKGMYITAPSPFAPSVDIVRYASDFEYKYNNGTNGKAFQMTIAFNYFEVNAQGDTSEVKTIVWPQNKEYRTTTSPTEVNGKFSILAFYNLISSKLGEPQPGVKRFVKMPESIEFRLAAADENYVTYMEITAPSSGIVQEKPSFTNLDGGYGLFASRYNVVLTKKLGTRTLDSLSRGIYTKNLGFANAYDQYYLSNGAN